MSTPEGIVTGLVVALSFVGIAVVILVRRADRLTSTELENPTHDDPTSR
jgi:hypothetical protein